MQLRPSSILALALLVLSPAVLVAADAEVDVLELARDVQPEALHAELHGYNEKFQHVDLAKRQNPPNNQTTSDPPVSSPPPSRTTSNLPTSTNDDDDNDTTPTDTPTPTPSDTGEPTSISTATVPRPTSEESEDTRPSSTISRTSIFTEPEPSITDEPQETTEPETSSSRPTNTSTSTDEDNDDEDETTTPIRRPTSTRLSTSRRTTTINGQKSTILSVVVVTPTETANVLNPTADPTNTAADLQDSAGTANFLDRTLLGGFVALLAWWL